MMLPKENRSEAVQDIFSKRFYIEGDPLDEDVTMGSKRRSFTQHPGSVRFQKIVESHKNAYLATAQKHVKTSIIRDIVHETRSNGARFLKQDKIGWYHASETAVFDKVGHAMRFESASAKRKGIWKRSPSPSKRIGSTKNSPPLTPNVLDKYSSGLTKSSMSDMQEEFRHTPMEPISLASLAIDHHFLKNNENLSEPTPIRQGDELTAPTDSAPIPFDIDLDLAVFLSSQPVEDMRNSTESQSRQANCRFFSPADIPDDDEEIDFEKLFLDEE